jgi:hypothetical protein
MSTDLIRYGVNYANTPSPQVSNVLSTADTLDNDIILPSNDVSTLVLELTGQQYTLLLSCVLNGATRHFPEDYQAIFEILIKAGKVALCDAIANCITNSDAVQDALAAALGGNNGGIPIGGEYGSGSNAPIPESVSTANLLDGATCDNDNLFAIALGVTNFLFDAVNDFYDIVEVATNDLELINALSDNVPVWGATPAAIALETALWIQETAQEEFDAFDTLAKRQDVACDLFCIMQEACTISFDDILNYFIGKTILAVTGQTIEELLIEIAGLSTTDNIGYASLAAAVGTVALGARFAGIRSLNWINVQMRSLFNDTNPDWSILCDCTPPADWRITYDFKVGAALWSADPYGLYVNGAAWGSVQVGVNDNLYITRTWSGTHTITRFSQYIVSSNGFSAAGFWKNAAVVNSVTTELSETAAPLGGGYHYIDWYGTQEDVTAIRTLNNPDCSDARWYIDTIIIEGTGTPPETNNPSIGVTVELL